jgi:hypothetical protein
MGLSAVEIWAKHLIAPAFLFYVLILPLDTVTLNVLRRLYKFLDQQTHITHNFRFILRYTVVILRRLRTVLLFEETRVLSHSIPPLLNYLNFHLDAIHKNPLHSGNNC